MDQLLSNEYVIDLATIGKGAAMELFDAELEKVLDNIADQNTDSAQAREITLKVKFSPSEDRKSAALGIQVKSKLAGHMGVSGAVYFGIVNGQRAAVESNPTQGKLFDKPREPGSLRTIQLKAAQRDEEE